MNQTQLATQKKMPPAKAFRHQAEGIARQLLTDWVGPDRAGEAVGRIAVALSAARSAAKDPSTFDKCSLESVGNVIAISALTGVMPGQGSTALAYAIPRCIKKQWTLGYQLSHRGINALAQRAGQQMIAVPIGMNDKVEIAEDGECSIKERDPDNPPTTEDELRGIALIVKNTNTGQKITCQWVAKKLINERRANSDQYQWACKMFDKGEKWAIQTDPWHVWYVEQAQKTAMHYAVNRGWCVIDDTEATRALSIDTASDLRTIDALAAVPKLSATEQLEQELLGGDTSQTKTDDQQPVDPEAESPTPYKRWRKTILAEGDPAVLLEYAVAIEEDKDVTAEERKVLAESITTCRTQLMEDKP